MTPTFNETTLAQLPALKVLHNLGWEYISKQEVREQRESSSEFILSDILKGQISKVNGGNLSEQDVNSAMGKLRADPSGLLAGNIEIYKRLISGVNVPAPSASGTANEKHLNYIDWDHPANNKFHCTCEFDAVQGKEHIRLDLVLFINGIPIVAIEAKSAEVNLKRAQDQLLRYQHQVPRLFAFIQILAVINSGNSKYGAAGCKEVHWSNWREEGEDNLGLKQDYINQVLAQKIPAADLDKMLSDLPLANDKSQEVAATQQNKFLISLFDKERCCDLLRNFIIVGPASKKIARGHQYFVMKNAIKRIMTEQGRERGGIVWHTQGSGKSMSMILMIKNLKKNLGKINARVILVSDRLDLNDQMRQTLQQADIKPVLPRTGKELSYEILETNSQVILTNVHKFKLALTGGESKEQDASSGEEPVEVAENSADARPEQEVSNPSENIFLLIDECHRTQYGRYARDMRRLLPNACYIGFTGTPLLEKYKKSTFLTFGSFIQPTYPIRKALADETVVPLYYEARNFEVQINELGIDKETLEISKELSSVEERVIKRKFSSAFVIRDLESIITKIAEDIAAHYKSYALRYPKRSNDIKGQLVVASKAHAVLYHKALRMHGVGSKVIISPPGQDTIEEESATVHKERSLQIVKDFWRDEVLQNNKDEREYEKTTIEKFKKEATPQILVVVDKLITGFDAEKNTILYLCKRLRDHTLLQAIARVNRTSPGKKHGLIVDYSMAFENLKEALTDYDELSGYSQEDIDETLSNVDDLLDEFDDVYKRVKARLSKDEGGSYDENWLKLSSSMINAKQRAAFQQDYVRFTELFAILASVGSFGKKYQGQFEQIDKCMEDGSRLNRYLAEVHNPKTPEFLIAEELMKTALNENVTADGFVPVGKTVPIYDLVGKDNKQPMMVRQERKPIAPAAKVEDRSSFNRAHKGLVMLAREVKSVSEAYPELAEMMSKLIKEALAECEQLALDFAKEMIALHEMNKRGDVLEKRTLTDLRKQFDNRKVAEVSLPACMEDEKESVEYYLVAQNILKQKKKNYTYLEEELCKFARNSFDLLEGDANRGWWNNIDSEKRVKLNTLELVWILEDEKEFPDGYDENITDLMMNIARARAKINFLKQADEFDY